MMIQSDFHIFQGGRYTTNQLYSSPHLCQLGYRTWRPHLEHERAHFRLDMSIFVNLHQTGPSRVIKRGTNMTNLILN